MSRETIEVDVPERVIEAAERSEKRTADAIADALRVAWDRDG